jgi:alpha-methylacyl-CoA racemase
MSLDGVRVLDLSRLLPGGYCTQLLQAQGATVTKVEPKAGDPIRALPGGSAYFDALHHGKQVVTLDLRSPSGRQDFLARVVDSDVLVEGFRPGRMERLELGYASLAAINPALVYCAITGYGSNGPLAQRAGHDLNYLARSGALSLMPRHDGIPTVPGLQVADLAGGLEAAFLIAAALTSREKTGRGQRLEVSMTDLIRSWTALPRAVRRADLAGLPLTGELPCYHVYAVVDGFLTVAALEYTFWAEF